MRYTKEDVVYEETFYNKENIESKGFKLKSNGSIVGVYKKYFYFDSRFRHDPNYLNVPAFITGYRFYKENGFSSLYGLVKQYADISTSKKFEPMYVSFNDDSNDYSKQVKKFDKKIFID